MKNYLSFGGGVNSVALHLFLLDQGTEFETIFVNHGTDWPETYEYVAMFQGWLKDNGHDSITELKPQVRTNDGKVFENLYDYFEYKRVFPFRQNAMCTARFKVKTLEDYQISPSFVYIGYAFDESHRAKITSKKGYEYRFPLIEEEITREGCKELIKSKGLPVPIKSGCYICPFQPPLEYRSLRRKHPNLFCNVEKLENSYIERRASEGKPPLYMIRDRPIKVVIEEDQMKLFDEMEYPPCQCGL